MSSFWYCFVGEGSLARVQIWSWNAQFIMLVSFLLHVLQTTFMAASSSSCSSSLRIRLSIFRNANMKECKPISSPWLFIIFVNPVFHGNFEFSIFRNANRFQDFQSKNKIHEPRVFNFQECKSEGGNWFQDYKSEGKNHGFIF